MSAVLDLTGEFVGFHYVYVIDPGATDPNQYDQATVRCEVDEENLLSCSVRDQDALQLYEDQLSIATVVDPAGTQSTFTLVQLA